MEKTSNEVKNVFTFKDPYVNKPIRKPSNAGTQFISEFAEDIDENGKKYLKEVGKTNVYEKIQEAAKGCEIYEIVDQCLKTGDASILNRGKGTYGDFTNMPDTRIQIMKAEKEFNSLNKEIRAVFDNDINVFKHSLMDGTFNERMKKYEDSKLPKVEAPETKKGELTNE